MQRHTVTRATIYLRVWPRRRNAFALYTGKQLAASVKEVRGKKIPLRILEDNMASLLSGMILPRESTVSKQSDLLSISSVC